MFVNLHECEPQNTEQGDACSADFLWKDKWVSRHFSTSSSIPVSVDLYKLVSTTVVSVCAMCMRVYACVLCTHDTGNLCKNLNHLYFSDYATVGLHSIKSASGHTKKNFDFDFDSCPLFDEECMFVSKNVFMHTVL